jgi:putative glutamine amidotransferase
MSKPLIGITTRNSRDADGHPTTSLQHTYTNVIVQAGGLPILIPSMLPEEDFQALYANVAGILFTGGGDISLKYFSGADHPRIGEVDESRDQTELYLMRSAVRDGKPILGICRGAQMMNVALGGTLYTHIYDELPGALDHAYPGDLRRALVHRVDVDSSSRSAKIFGETVLQVNSLHHQGLKDLAPGLQVAGRAPDGLAELVELDGHPFAISVQWHPEWLTDQAPTRRLFKAFVDAVGAV